MPQPIPQPLGNGCQIWRGLGGTYQVSDGGGWIPGIYADEAAARKALEVAGEQYGPLAAAVDAEVRGIGDDYRPVTVEDLEQLA